MARESVGGNEQNSALSRVQGEMTGIRCRTVTPRTPSEVFKMIGHQVNDGVVVAPFGGETQREMAGNGSVFPQFFQV